MRVTNLPSVAKLPKGQTRTPILSEPTPESTTTESEYDRFESLTKRLLSVPKKEIKEQEKKKVG